MQKKLASTVSVILVFITLTSCHNFYKASSGTTRSHTVTAVDSLIGKNRYFILPNGSQACYMKDLGLNSERKTLPCTLDTLAPEHRLHLMNGRRGKMQYKKFNPNEFNVLNEVHIFIEADSTVAIGENYSLPLEGIRKMEIIEKDKKRTTVSYVVGGVAYTLGAFAIPVIIFAASGGMNWTYNGRWN